MSADLVLIAAPNDPEWLARYRWLRGADMTTSADGPEGDEYIDEDGYIRSPSMDAALAENGHGPARTLTWDQSEETRRDLGLDGDREWLWVGQVSWLKASLTGDSVYIPGPVEAVSSLVGDGVLLTTGRAKAITVALNQPNDSIYGKARYYYTSDRQRVPMSARKVAPGVFRYNKPPHDRLYSGVAPARRVKHWLHDHVGSVVVQESW